MCNTGSPSVAMEIFPSLPASLMGASDGCPQLMRLSSSFILLNECNWQDLDERPVNYSAGCFTPE